MQHLFKKTIMFTNKSGMTDYSEKHEARIQYHGRQPHKPYTVVMIHELPPRD